MTTAIKIKPLNDDETIAVLKLPKFNILKPETCGDCGHSTDFTRKVFSIGGVRKDKRCDDEVQNLICSYIRETYGIAYVFFKSPNDKFFADTACCPKCQSTRIIFDIELTEDLLRQTSILTGKSIEKTRLGIEATAERLAATKDA